MDYLLRNLLTNCYVGQPGRQSQRIISHGNKSSKSTGLADGVGGSQQSVNASNASTRARKNIHGNLNLGQHYIYVM